MKIILSLMFLLFINAKAETSLFNNQFEAALAQQYVKFMTELKSTDELFSKVVTNSADDKKYVEEQQKSLKNASLPKFTHIKDRLIQVEENNEKIDIEFISALQGKFKINGYAADFSKYKNFTEKEKYLKRILKLSSQKGTKGALLQMLVGQKANAIIPLIVYPVIVVGAGCWVYVLNELRKMNNQAEAATLGSALLAAEGSLRTGLTVKSVTCNNNQVTMNTDDSTRPQVIVEARREGYTHLLVSDLCACGKDSSCSKKLVKMINENASRNSSRPWVADQNGNWVENQAR